ncbi:YibE/F family protein [Pseudonocardia lacus]|uniref:YibE/F family protein n=1 Tax=Pseudonocardia lacus TaxID=2835865 RepID=UPI001BDC6BBC|nr:YibE/F family protein [Pseudonocardia lacus]
MLPRDRSSRSSGARHRRAAEPGHRHEPPSPPGQQHGHQHGHGHGPPPRADRRVRTLLWVLLTPCVLATLVGLVLLYPAAAPAVDAESAGPRIDGHVSAAAERACDEEAGPDAGPPGCLALGVQLAEGPLAGRTIEVLISAPGGRAPFGAGDDVVLTAAGGDPADPAAYVVVDLQREVPLLALAAVFVVAVVALGRMRGLAALAGLGLTVVVLVGFVLPAVLAGRNALLVAVVGCCAIMFGALYLTHGMSARTSTAVLGTLVGLVLIALLGITFAELAHLTGVDEDTASLAATLGTEVDGRGLVLAGLVIGALGALDDVTVTQTTAVWELRAADPRLPAAALFRSAMRIGRDHLASAVNTLVLAYAGTALPLLLLFSVAERGLGDTLTTQVIATEVVRTLVGSIGLVVSVPVTTALAVAVATRGTLRPPRALPSRTKLS